MGLAPHDPTAVEHTLNTDPEFTLLTPDLATTTGTVGARAAFPIPENPGRPAAYPVPAHRQEVAR
ncbi:hypothetical protein ACWCW7_22575 [Nocardia tengchongensis]